MLSRVSVPSHTSWSIPASELVLRLDRKTLQKDCSELISLTRKHYQKIDIGQIFFELESLELAGFFVEVPGEHPRLRICITDKDLPEVIKWKSFLTGKDVTLVIEKTFGRPCRTLQFLSRFDSNIEFLPEALLDFDSEELRILGNEFLFSPFLVKRVEPLFSIFTCVVNSGINLTLWDIFHQRMGKDFYVTSEEKIAISSQYAELGLYLEGYSQDLTSLYGATIAFDEQQRYSGNPGIDACNECVENRLCCGFFRSIYPRADCDAFKYLINLFRRHAVWLGRELSSS
jgi:hypothetical protein